MEDHHLCEDLECIRYVVPPVIPYGYEPLANSHKTLEVIPPKSDSDDSYDSQDSSCSSGHGGHDACPDFRRDSDALGYPDPISDSKVPKWCSCGNCREMPSELENRCCRMSDQSEEDSSRLEQRVQETTGDTILALAESQFVPSQNPSKCEFAGDTKCITNHQGFADCCLSIHVVRMYFHEFIKKEGRLGDDEHIHEVFRYLAFRNFALFIWRMHRLKKGKAIPSCATLRIRQAFPLEANAGFKYDEK